MAQCIPEFKGTIACGMTSATGSKSILKMEIKDEIVDQSNFGHHSKKSDIVRHEEADRKRLESMKRQRESYTQRKNVVSNALKSIDQPTKGIALNKKIKFSSSSDEEFKKEEPSKKPSSKEKSSKIISSTISDGRQQLFDNEDEEEDLNIEFNNAKFDGVVGAKLLEMQSRQGIVDQRFRLDERFLDNDQNGTIKPKIVNEDEQILKQERRANIRILGKVLGKPLEQEKEEKLEKQSTFLPYLRYDPTNPAHRQFQVSNDDDVDEEKKSISSSSDSEVDVQTEKEDESLMNKSQDIKIGLDPDFAESLRQKQTETKIKFEKKVEPSSSGFSLRQLFGRDNPITEESQVSKNISSSAINKPSWQFNMMSNKDSSDEEEMDTEPDMDSRKDQKLLEKKTKKQSSLFFFHDIEDERIAEGAKFMKVKDSEQSRQKWEEQRLSLIQYYKGRRKEALKIKKQRLKPVDHGFKKKQNEHLTGHRHRRQNN